MGWTGIYGATRASIIAELTDGRGETKTLAKRLVGSNLWTVQEWNGERGVVLYLLWGNHTEYRYKDVSEGMGPYEDDCPLKFFALAGPAPNEWATAFRARCVAAHEARTSGKTFAAALKPGDAFALYGKSYTYSGRRKTSLLAEGGDGRMYRIGPKHFPKLTSPREKS